MSPKDKTPVTGHVILQVTGTVQMPQSPRQCLSIELVLEGTGELYAGKTAYRLAAGYAILRSSTATLTAYSENPLRLLCVAINKELLHGTMVIPEEGSLILPGFLENTDITEPVDTNELLALCLEQLGHNSAKTPAYLQLAKTTIEAQYDEVINLDILAGITGASKYKLLKGFKKHFGYTPIEYLTFIRMQEAKRLLLSTQDTVTSIAEAVGIGSTSYFSSRFKKLYGLTPNQYRETE